MTLPGIDISYAQDTTPSLTGLAFCFVRATYRNYVDSHWVQHSATVRAEGKVLGAYHFLYLTPSVENQVATFLATAEHADLLVLDVEGETNTTAGYAMARQFISLVHEAGRQIGLYHSLSGYPDLGQDFDWIAKWSTTAPSRSWDFWQYGSTTIQGHKIDGDTFHGDAAALAALIGHTTGGGSGDVDIMGLALRIPLPPVLGDVSFPAGLQPSKVSDGTRVTTASAGTRPGYAVTHVNGSDGYVVNLTTAQELYFFRAQDVTFTPAPTPAAVPLGPGLYEVAP